MRPNAWIFLSVASTLSLMSAPLARAEELEKQARTILEQHCFRCHSHQAGKSKGELMLDARSSMLKGGETGPAVVPGDLAKSLLIEAVEFNNEDLRMPPAGKIPEDQIAALRAWVKAGAPWAETGLKKGVRTAGSITEEDRRYWAFQPIRKPALPNVTDAKWAKTPIDHFILHRLEKEGLKPASPASREVLIRRVYFDLIGLPPSSEETDAFVNDTSPDAYEKLIDRLLASPRYGEHWARHWLDLVRYAESDGYRLDSYRPHAWRYRDYVIQSFNEDKPYNQFLREQIAGDELKPGDPTMLAATGFLTAGIYEYNQRDVRTQWDNMMNEMVDVTAETVLGLGMGCAKCHDHKYDPILQKDYFRFRAFFEGVMPSMETPYATQTELAKFQKQQAIWEQKTATIRKEIEAIENAEGEKAAKSSTHKFPPEIRDMMLKKADERTPFERQLVTLAYRQIQYELDRIDTRIKGDAKDRLLALRKDLTKFDSLKPTPLPLVQTTMEVGVVPPETYVPRKGKTPVEPGFLTVLGEQAVKIVPAAQSSGRRRALVEWMTRPENPLTTRVLANRLWQAHFGRGIAENSNDFGKLGGLPSHPELLDWLAATFMEQGWSLKKMHRLILLSQAYQQSAASPNEELGMRKDPENLWVWRRSPRRLQAEQIRDAILSCTAKLDLKAGGPSVETREPRRSVYAKVMRNTRDPLLDVFDWPEHFQSTGQRNVTTTPTQALLMLNSPFMQQQGDAFSAKLHADHPKDEEARVEAAFRRAFGRSATAQEKSTVFAFLKNQTKRIQPIADVGPETGKLPFREGRAALFSAKGSQFQVEHPMKANGNFTVEAYILARSVFEDSTVRTIAAHWNGETKNGAGWSFGVTGKKSSYKPQMLVLQMWGQDQQGKPAYEAVFSGLQIALNKPYYVAVSVDLKDTGENGITFHARDLSNDEEPIQSYPAKHNVVKLPEAIGPFVIGGAAGKVERPWDGLIDDVRFSNSALKAKQLLPNSDITAPSTVAFWRFEPDPGMLRDSTTNGHHLIRPTSPATPTATSTDPRRRAWADFCQMLMNANEFVYVD